MTVADREATIPLIKTKLRAPTVRSAVARDGLIQAVSEAVLRPLTLVYGPTGSGKTTLLAQWCDAEPGCPVAWLSLDGADNEPARFWQYVLAALRSVEPRIGARSLPLLRAPAVDLIEELLPVLVNELADAQEPIVLVLDDYQLVEHELIHEGVRFLLEYLPATLRLVIASRSEPPLPVASLRAAGNLSELTPGQLRFSHDEAELLLNGVHGLELQPGAIARLLRRTEGWAAGLYLAALSLRGRADASAFIDSFAGSDRLIVDYLAAEVLDEQPDDVVEFMLATSVLERFCAPLCDAVAGTHDSRRLLDAIERSNYFLLPLDSRRLWYRYHHLFGDLLRHELNRRWPGRAAELRRHAAEWFVGQGMVAEGVAQLIAAGDRERVAELIATNWFAYVNTGDRGAVAHWLSALPARALRSDGRLCIARAGLATVVGVHREILPWLDLAADAAVHPPSEEPVRQLEADVLRASACELLGDMRAARELALRAAMDGPDDHNSALCLNLQGSTARWLELERGVSGPLARAVELGSGRSPVVGIFALGQLALIASERGDWRGCRGHVERAFGLIEEAGLEEYWMGSLAHTAAGLLLQHDRRLEAAGAELARALELARRGVGVVELSYVLVALAGLRRELGDSDHARALVGEARELITGAAEPGTLVPRLLDQAERRLRIGTPENGTSDLTERELAVLELLPSGMSAREIGGELGISLNTIKTHTKSLYRKLGAAGRRDAVVLGRAHGLL